MKDREDGLAALQRGDYEQAVIALERALAASPDDFLILLYLGGAYHQTKRDAEAVRLLLRAVQLQPQSAQAHYNLGISLDRIRRPREAIAALERALALQPDYSMARNALLRLKTMPQHVVPAASSPYASIATSGDELQFVPLSTPYGSPPPAQPAPLLNASEPSVSPSPASPPSFATLPGQPPSPGYTHTPPPSPYAPIMAPQPPSGYTPSGYAPPVSPYTPPAAYPPPPYGQPQLPYGPAGYPYAGYSPQMVQTCPDATNALILAILGIFPCFFLGFLFGPLSIVKAVQAKRQIRDNPYFMGEGTANVAIVLGTLSTLLSTIPWLMRLAQ